MVGLRAPACPTHTLNACTPRPSLVPNKKIPATLPPSHSITTLVSTLPEFHGVYRTAAVALWLDIDRTSLWRPALGPRRTGPPLHAHLPRCAHLPRGLLTTSTAARSPSPASPRLLPFIPCGMLSMLLPHGPIPAQACGERWRQGRAAEDSSCVGSCSGEKGAQKSPPAGHRAAANLLSVALQNVGHAACRSISLPSIRAP